MGSDLSPTLGELIGGDDTAAIDLGQLLDRQIPHRVGNRETAVGDGAMPELEEDLPVHVEPAHGPRAELLSGHERPPADQPERK